MQALSLPAAAGFQWIRAGLSLFLRQPFAVMTLVLAFLFTWFLLISVPLIGPIIAPVLLPGFSAAFMIAGRTIEQRQLVVPTLLVAPFRRGRSIAERLLALGAVYLVTVLLVEVSIALVDDGELSRVFNDATLSKGPVELTPSLQLTMLIAAALSVAVTVVFWFAPVLVVFHDVTPVKAVFFSIVAVWRSRSAFLVFGISMLIGTLVSIGTVGVVLDTIGLNMQFQTFFLTPLLVAVIAVFHCSAYASYREAFGLRDDA